MKYFIFALAVLISTFYTANAAMLIVCYDWGEENTACSRMKPIIYESMKEIEDKEYYQVVPNSNTFYPGGKLYIRVVGKGESYSGIIMSVIRSTGKSQGSWQESHKYKYRRFDCDGMSNSGIAEANETKTTIPIGADALVWNAPATCDFDKPFYELKATVVKSPTEILTGLSVALKCIPRPSIPEPDLSCGRNFILGNESMSSLDASFETDFDGWWNDPKAALRWIRNTGSTPSPATGPSFAYDGKYYIYSEASTPALQGQEAILNSPPGLRGCFCVRLQCHMWGGTGTYFEVRLNNKVAFNHTTTSNAWVEGFLTVNDPHHPQIQLVMHRGVDFRGDIGVDAVTIKPGVCEEDLKI